MASTDFKVKNGLVVNGTSTVQHIVPSADITYDLGTAENRFRDLYLSTNTLYLGSTALSIDVNGKLATTETIDGGESNTLGIAWVQWTDQSVLTIRTINTSDYNQKLQTLGKGDAFTLVDGQNGNFTDTVLTATGPATTSTEGSLEYTNYNIPVDIAATSDVYVYNFVLKQSDVVDVNQLSDEDGLLGSVDLTGYATESYVDTNVATKVQFFEQANAPTVATNSVKAGDLWKDTDTGTIYIAAVENSTASWFAI